MYFGGILENPARIEPGPWENPAQFEPGPQENSAHERTRPIENAMNVAVNCWKLVCSVQLFKVHQFCTQNRYSS